jgi:hypothetical protein
MKKLYSIALIVTVLLLGLACQREEFATGSSDNIELSVDTISFDTIFTQVGSVTQLFKIYNRHDRYIKISRAYLKEGAASNFRINIDGFSADAFNNIEVPPKDSLFVFIEVTLDPNGGNLPLVIYDAVVFETNGNISEVTLEAFGQDVHLLRGKIIETQTWTNDKPYLIYNGVAIDSNHTLTIEAGTKVYFHFNASLIVWGNLDVKGTFTEPVVFEGDRFDMGYGETAGRWGTIFIHPRSRGNRVNYAIIKNAQVGFQVGEPGEDTRVPSLELKNTIIRNSSFASVVAFGAEISSYNCIFADSQFNGLTLLMGGKYNFYHSTISMVGALESNVAITRYLRKSPSYAVLLTNWYGPYYYLDEYYFVDEKTLSRELTEANFFNSIVYGNNNIEFEEDDNGESGFSYFFDHCLLKQPEDSLDISDETHFNQVVLNEYPRFVNDSVILGELNYRLDTLSPAKDIGSLDIVNAQLEFLGYDYDGNSRTADGKPDLGAFERQE